MNDVGFSKYVKRACSCRVKLRDNMYLLAMDATTSNPVIVFNLVYEDTDTNTITQIGHTVARADKHDVWLTDVVVDERYRNQGVGTDLVRAVLRFFADEPKVHLWVDKNNEHAKKLYDRLGFRRVYTTEDTELHVLFNPQQPQQPKRIGVGNDE